MECAKAMVIGDRLSTLREQKGLSQRDIQKRTNLLCCYVSRVENGIPFHPSRTWKSWLGRLGFLSISYSMPAKSRPNPCCPSAGMRRTLPGAASRKDARLLTKFRRLLARMEERDRRLLLYMTQKMARH